MKTDARVTAVLGAGLAFVLLAASCGGGPSPAGPSPTASPATPTAAASRPTAAAAATPAGAPADSTPAPQPTPAGSAAAPTPSPTPAQPAAGATPVPRPTPEPRAASVSLTVRAANLAFDVSTIRVRDGTTVTATLQNDDPGVEHNLSFSLAGLPHGETCAGPCSRTQTFTASGAGSYYFLCTLHDMVGTFIVEP